MFQFPFGTLHQLNLDWFLQQWEIYKQEWADTQAGIDNALQGEIDRVEDAMTDLYNARDVAVQAKEDAEDAADSVVADAAQCGADALKSEGYAVGEQDGTPVGAGSPYYQQNAKYYKVEAGTYRYLSEAYAKGEMGGSPVAPGEAGYQDNAKYYKDAADLDASTASAAAASADTDALLAEGYSVGEQNGTPVSSGSPYYQNNAKYYAAEAQQDKDDADTFKDAANQAALRAEGYSSGTQNGTPVSSGSPYYENNAAYFYNQSAGTSGDLAQAMIAAEEASSTASADHVPDTASQYFRYSGKYYKATTTIATGATITPGTNCQEITVSGELALQTDKVNAVCLFPYYDNLPDKFVDQRSGRRVTIEKNRITVEKTGSGSSYLWYSIFGKKYLGSGQYTDPPTDFITDDDFVEFNDYDVKMFITRWVSSVKSSSRSGLYLISKDPDSGVISNLYALNDGFSIVRVLNATDNFPVMLNNGNFGLVFRTVNANNSGTTEFSFSFEQYQNPLGQYQKTLIASKNYQVNEFFTFGQNLYKVIQPIANGAAIIPGTNVSATSVTDQLTYFANNI